MSTFYKIIHYSGVVSAFLNLLCGIVVILVNIGLMAALNTHMLWGVISCHPCNLLMLAILALTNVCAPVTLAIIHQPNTHEQHLTMGFFKTLMIVLGVANCFFFSWLVIASVLPNVMINSNFLLSSFLLGSIVSIVSGIMCLKHSSYESTK
jgi:hypothetical protein